MAQEKYQRSQLTAMHAALEAWLDGTVPIDQKPYWDDALFTFLLLDLLKDARDAFQTLKTRVDNAGIP